MHRVYGSFVSLLLLLFTLSASAQVDTAIVGRLEVLVTDFAESAVYEYSLKTREGSRVRLEFEHGRASNALAGALLRVRGKLHADGTLLVSDVTRQRERVIESNALLPRAESVLVLIGHYPGTTPQCTRATAETIFFANAPALSVKNYYLTSAHGGLTGFTGRVLDPIPLTEFSPADPCRPFDWADFLDGRARAQGVDPANYTRTQYVVPNCGSGVAGFSFLNDKRSFVFACGLQLMGHELGHSFGMHHANQNGVEYADPYDIMRGSAHGNTPPELNAPHRIQMNFMPSERIATASASAVYSIGALEIDGLQIPQVLRIRRSNLTGDYIYLSYRTRVGTFDGGIQPAAATHVYRWDGAQTDLRAVLENGGVYEEPGIARVEQLSTSATQSTVRIDLGSPTPPPPAGGSCSPNATTLCLRDNRFRVTATFKNEGVTNSARAVSFSNDTGYFWFFQASNTELAVKVLDGRPVNNRFWVFFGGLTSLEYTIAVTDTATGATETYLTNAGNLCGGADTDFGTTAPVLSGVAPSVTSGVGPTNLTCTADSDTLCLQPGGDVIKVETTFSGGAAPSGLLPLTLQAGYFTFSNPGNVELITKVLDGRPLNARYWIFTGALSNQAYTVMYTNTRSGRWVRVQNPSGNYCGTAITHLLY